MIEYLIGYICTVILIIFFVFSIMISIAFVMAVLEKTKGRKK